MNNSAFGFDSKQPKLKRHPWKNKFDNKNKKYVKYQAVFNLPAMANDTFIAAIFIFPLRVRDCRIWTSMTNARIWRTHCTWACILLCYRSGRDLGHGTSWWNWWRTGYHRWGTYMLHVLWMLSNLWLGRNLQFGFLNLNCEVKKIFRILHVHLG